MLEISVVIPTKNRATELISAVDSVMVQSHLPCELIIVDQSEEDDLCNIIESRYANTHPKIKLIYIYNRDLKGLVHAKEVGIKHASSSLVCFLEDDIVLTRDFLKKLSLTFQDKKILGCSGVIINHPIQPKIKNILFNFFHIGIFKDSRYKIYCNYESYNELIKTDKLSGGLTMWRKSLFDVVKFDNNIYFHYFEDIEFSTRVEFLYPGSLRINPSAQIYHYPSLINRSSPKIQYRNKIQEAIRYYKKRRTLPYANVSIIFLLFGYFLLGILKFNIFYQIVFLNAIKEELISP